jgi:hypothetical protein
MRSPGVHHLLPDPVVTPRRGVTHRPRFWSNSCGEPIQWYAVCEPRIISLAGGVFLTADLTSPFSFEGEFSMAKYGASAKQEVKRAMHKTKQGTQKSGRSGKKVKSRKQAIAIGLSKARKKGAKVPRKKKG